MDINPLSLLRPEPLVRVGEVVWPIVKGAASIGTGAVPPLDRVAFLHHAARVVKTAAAADTLKLREEDVGRREGD